MYVFNVSAVIKPFTTSFNKEDINVDTHKSEITVITFTALRYISFHVNALLSLTERNHLNVHKKYKHD